LDNWESFENCEYQHFNNHYKFDALEASAKGGCRLCSLFVAGFSGRAIRTLRSKPEGRELSVHLCRYESRLFPLHYILQAGYFDSEISFLYVKPAKRPGKSYHIMNKFNSVL